MNRSLRKAHFRLVAVLTPVAIGIFGASIAARRAIPLNPTPALLQPPAAELQETGRRLVHAEGFDVEVRGLIDGSGARFVEFRPLSQPHIADLQAYIGPGRNATFDGQVRLLGSVYASCPVRFPLPVDFDPDPVGDLFLQRGHPHGGGSGEPDGLLHGRAVSSHFQSVNWNRQKQIYDGVALGGVLLFIGLFAAASLAHNPDITAETILIRGLGLSGLVLLHLILCIGPLCRLNPSFLPLLYNRRHLGVLMCLLALGHACFAIFQFHALGVQPAVVSLLTGTGKIRELGRFPFELLGLVALMILWIMATTSHDFWLELLSAPVWKALHMMVYLAYVLLLGHVGLGALQDDQSGWFTLLLAAGAVLVLGLHLAAGWREKRGDVLPQNPSSEWVDCGSVDQCQEGRARTAAVGKERVAIVKHANGISVVSNVCRHQGGPLGEGRIVDGCLTCPWHGYTYQPESGASPPPFTEKIPTYNVRVVNGRVLVHPKANPAGTHVPAAKVDGSRETA